MVFPQVVSGQTDSLYLDESKVVSRKNESMIRIAGESLRMSSDMLRTAPAFLGSTDPIRMAKYLPSVQAATEIDAGIHVQGSEHSHNLISSGGVPIYGATHLFGLFSVFNPSHFESIDFSTSAPEANRIGGKLDMVLPEEAAKKLKGDVSLGLLAFQGSITVPTSKSGKGSITASLRRSYLNLLYGRFLRYGSSPLHYGFTDVNLTGIWAASGRDRIWVDAYYGNDYADLDAGDGSMAVILPWHNAMGAVHHQHDYPGVGRFHHKAYVTHYGLSPVISYAGVDLQIPSDITSAGYDFDWKSEHLHAGLSAIVHRAVPQQFYSSGSFIGDGDNTPPQWGEETSVFAAYLGNFGIFDINASLKGLLWHGPDGKWVPNLSPEAVLGCNLNRGGRLELSGGITYQHLSQAGFAGIGLPFDFWMLAGTVCPPQRSIGGALRYKLSLFDDAYTLSSELYYRSLTNQIEYSDALSDLFSSQYSLEDALRCGTGRAYGANLMIHKRTGALTGWLSLSCGRSLRTFDPEEGEVPASHERLFEADLVLNYKLGKWDFSLTSVVASGTPYTPATDIYILANFLTVEYGPYNSARLPVYHRTDIGATWTIGKTGPLTHSVNLSVFNVFYADNPIYRQLVINRDGFHYDYEGIGIRLMPSIAYSMQF